MLKVRTVLTCQDCTSFLKVMGHGQQSMFSRPAEFFQSSFNRQCDDKLLKIARWVRNPSKEKRMTSDIPKPRKQ
jgi:hypothetical protein